MTNKPQTINDENITFNHIAIKTKDGSNFTQDVNNTLDKWITVLSKYCGPLASHGIIVGSDKRTVSDVDIFTKDGITLVTSTASENFLDYIIRRLLVTVGERVDNVASDGTTTAMLLLILMLKNSQSQNEYLTNYKNNFKLNSTLARTFESTFDNVCDIIKTHTYTIDNLKELLNVKYPELTERQLIKHIAYTIALVSSKGDVKLSETAAEYISHIPVETLNGSWSIENDLYETDTTYSCVIQPYDWLINSPMYTNEQLLLNDKNGTIGTYEDCDCVYLLKELSGVYSTFIKGLVGLEGIPEPTEQLTNSINMIRSRYGIPKDYVQEKNLVVVVTSDEDIELNKMIIYFNTTRRNKIIVVADITQMNTLRISKSVQDCVNATCGKITPFDSSILLKDTFENCILHNVGVTLLRSECQFRNLIISDNTDSSTHPLYHTNREDYPFYHQTLDGLKEVCKFRDQSTGAKNFNQLETKVLEQLRSLMYAKKRVSFKIGGNIHHVLSTDSVIKDVLGSILSALTKGFVFGGYFRILQILKSKNTTVCNDIIQQSIEQMLRMIYTQDDEQLKLVFDETFKTFMEFDLYQNKSSMVLCWDSCSNEPTIKISDEYNPTKYSEQIMYLIQPVSGYISQLVRYKDIIVKLINTSDVIDTRLM